MKLAEQVKPILIVEDEAIMRESLRDWLTDGGYPVEAAEEGEKALKAIDQRSFSLLILDLRLPGKGGLELLREARAKQPQLKGIIITAYPSVQTAVGAMKEGAIDYLSKPFEMTRLEEAIRRTLGPVQLEIKPGKAMAEPAVPQVAEVEKIAPEAPEEVPAHLRNITDQSALIQALLEIQDENRWLPEKALSWLGQKLGVPLTQIYHIATFYKAFGLVPQGRHMVSVCLGTACHVRGTTRLLDKVTEALKIKAGATTRDLNFSLNTVNCLGCCALGPVMMVDETYYSNPSRAEMKKIFEACE